MPSPKEITDKNLEDFEHFVRDPRKKVKQIVRKITHSGETDLSKDDLRELKTICKVSENDLMALVQSECMKHLRKDHSQVRVSTVKLIDYLFQKSHKLREKILDVFDLFLELTLAITERPKVELKLPPPKKYASLLQELSAKCIYKWHVDFGEGYEKLKYAFRFLSEHKLVDFNRFRVNTREQLIKQQKLAEQQERILNRSVENRLRELQELKPEIDQVLTQIQSLIDCLIPNEGISTLEQVDTTDCDRNFELQQHGIANLSQTIEIEFSPFVEVKKNKDNKDILQNLRELKRQLIDGKMAKLISIEKTISKKSDQMVSTLREIIDLKNRCANYVLKLGELNIVSENSKQFNKSTLNDSGSDSDDNDQFEEVQSKEDIESYIPKSMRYEYGLAPIDPKELDERNRVSLDDERFLGASNSLPSTSNIGANQSNLVLSCNVKLESGKLCPRRDKVKCPFHGRIIPRDHLGVPLSEEDRKEEEKRNKKLKGTSVPEWQDPQLLAEIRAATGIDLTMPSKGPGRKTKARPGRNLADPKTCDLTPKRRLQKKLRLLVK